MKDMVDVEIIDDDTTSHLLKHEDDGTDTNPQDERVDYYPQLRVDGSPDDIFWGPDE